MRNSRLIKIIIGVVCTVWLFFLSIGGLFYTTLANEGFMNEQIKQANYIQKVTKEINGRVQSYHQEARVTPELLADSVSEELVKKNIEHFVKETYRGKQPSLIQATELEEHIKETIHTYKTEHEINIEEGIAGEELALHMIGGIFERSVQPSYLHLFIRGINDLSHQVLHYAWGIVSVSLLILAGFMYFNPGSIRSRIKKFACSLMGAGLISLALAATLYYAQILQTDEQMESLQGLMRTYLSNFTLIVLLVGGSEIVVGGFAWLLARRENKKRTVGQNQK